MRFVLLLLKWYLIMVLPAIAYIFIMFQGHFKEGYRHVMAIVTMMWLVVEHDKVNVIKLLGATLGILAVFYCCDWMSYYVMYSRYDWFVAYGICLVVPPLCFIRPLTKRLVLILLAILPALAVTAVVLIPLVDYKKAMTISLVFCIPVLYSWFVGLSPLTRLLEKQNNVRKEYGFRESYYYDEYEPERDNVVALAGLVAYVCVGSEKALTIHDCVELKKLLKDGYPALFKEFKRKVKSRDWSFYATQAFPENKPTGLKKSVWDVKPNEYLCGALYTGVVAAGLSKEAYERFLEVAEYLSIWKSVVDGYMQMYGAAFSMMAGERKDVAQVVERESDAEEPYLEGENVTPRIEA